MSPLRLTQVGSAGHSFGPMDGYRIIGITSLQGSVNKLETAVAALQEKCIDMEGRMRRSNIRILNVAEGPGSSSPDSVSKLLKEVLGMDREVLVDRSHRGLQPKQPGAKPRVIVAKLHYYKDCVEILRRAREAGPLQFKGSTILIFPDYPPIIKHRKCLSQLYGKQ